MNAPNVEYINPFVDAASHTFETMCGVEAKRDKIYLKGQGDDITGVSGVIGMGGVASGAVVLNLSVETALQAVGKFVGEEYTEVNGDIIDGVGELINIVAGDAKNRLVKNGYAFDIGLPKIIVGDNYFTSQSSTVPCVVILFSSEIGPFSVEVSLKKES